MSAEVVQVEPLLGCGHSYREVVSSDEGTAYCGACARENGNGMDGDVPVEDIDRDGRPIEEPVLTTSEAEPGSHQDDPAQTQEGEDPGDEEEAAPGLALQPYHSVRGNEQGPRGCWAISNRTGEPCGSPQMRGRDYCASHSGLGISADPAAYSPVGHEAQRRNREVRASMRLLYGKQRNTGPRAALRAAAEAQAIALAGRAVSAALDPNVAPEKAGALALRVISEAEPRDQATLEISGALDEDAIDRLSLSELLRVAEAHGIVPSPAPQLPA